MKVRLLVCLLPLMLDATFASAQYGTGIQRLMGNKRSTGSFGCHRIYLGIGTGLNNPTGLAGGLIDVAIISRLSANFGVGVGTWGMKGALEARYYFEPCNRGFAIGLGGTYSMGIIQATIKGYKTITGSTETGVFDLRPSFNAMLSGYWFRDLGNSGHRMHFQAGYSLPLQGDQLRQTSGAPIDRAAPRPLTAIPPGGPIVAMGISLGLGRF